MADGDKKHIFDNPRNVKIVIRALIAVSVGLFVADFVVERHEVHWLESILGMYAAYGFVACVLLVLIAKEMRKLLMRAEDYYDDE